MSLVRPSFSHIFLNRRSICSAVSLPRSFTLIILNPSKSYLNQRPAGTCHVLPAGGPISLANVTKCSSRARACRTAPKSRHFPHGRPRTQHPHPRPLPRSGRHGLSASQPLFPVFRDGPGGVAPFHGARLRRSGEGGNLLCGGESGMPLPR